MDTRRKTGILGGSFNPPHLGHLQIAEAVYREFGLSEVLLLPLGTPPHKRDIAPKEARREMCRMLVQAGEGLALCTMELEREGYTYTVDTLSALHKADPERVFYYIIGTDTLFQLESWRNFREVFRQTEFICVPRPGDAREAVLDKIRAMRRDYQKEILLASAAGPDISSTEVRERVARGQSTEGLLLPEVRSYIDQERLYVD